MKTKIVYMILGAIIASIGYLIGSINNLNAEDDVARVKDLHVSGGIYLIKPDGSGSSMLLTPSRIFMRGGLAKSSSAIRITADNIHMFSNQVDKGKISVLETDLKNRPLGSNWIRLSASSIVPFIDIQKAEGKKITLSIDDQSSISVSNGGLKSKTIRVE